MNENSVSAVNRLAWGSAVNEVIGVIDVIHPKKSGTGWALQNGVMKDPRTGVTIEFMLSKNKNEWKPEVVGRTVRLTTARGEPMIWKEQTAKPNVNNGKPFAKLEVPASILIEWLEETPSLFSQHPEAALRSPEPSMARDPAPKVSPATPIMGTEGVRGELRRMIALHALTKSEVAVSPFIKDASQQDEIAWRLFNAGCANGLHNQINPTDVLMELDPNAIEQLRPKFHELMGHFQGKDKSLKIVLVGAGLIDIGQDLSTLSEEKALAALESPEVRSFMADAERKAS